MKRNTRWTGILALCLPLPALAQEEDGPVTDEWSVAASLHDWFPDLKGDTRIGQALEDLQFKGPALGVSFRF